MKQIADARILIIATDGFEDSELLEPRRILLEHGADVTLASLETGEIKGDNGATITAETAIEDVDDGDYDALLLPGGTKNPDKLRMHRNVVDLVRTFVESGRPVGAICHAPWLLAEAGVLGGRTVTGWPSIRTDLRNAGAEVVDRESVTDGNLVTSRKPEDIPAFTEAFIRVVEKAEVPLATA
jgi:protease I